MYQNLNNHRSKRSKFDNYLPIMRLMLRYLAVIGVLALVVWLSYKQFALHNNNSINGSSNSELDSAKLLNRIVEETVTKNQALINLNELFHVGECLLREAGKQIVKLRQQHNENLDLNRKQKDNSIVTKADLISHTIIVHTLNYKYAHLRVVSEESNGSDSGFSPEYYLSKCDTYKQTASDKYAQLKDIKIFIDPLDATQEYSENLVEYVTVMFCMVIQGKPKAGIIHNPFSNRTFTSFLETKAPNEQKSISIEKPRIVISRSHTGTAKTIIEQRLKKSQLIIAAGSGYKTMKVLDDVADLYLHTSKIYKWDVCAPNAILVNLGGNLTDRSGDKVDYLSNDKESKPVSNGVVASLYNHEFYLKIFRTFN